MPYHVLLVGESSASQPGLRQALSREFSVDRCVLANEALDHIERHGPDLLVLDLSLRDMDGLTFLRVLRETEIGKIVPVIVVCGRKTEETVERAFAYGAEDLMEAPVDPGELIARMHAVLRRNTEHLDHWGTPLKVGEIEIDPSQRLCSVKGKRVALRPREFELLEILMRKAGRVLKRPYLLEAVWGMDSKADTRAVDMVVSRLRRKLGARTGRKIETVTKLGYCLRSR